MTDLIRKLSDLKNPTKAEEQLLAEYWTGEFVEIGEEVPDEGAGAEVEIRAGLIRYLLLGGCDDLPHPVHEKGVLVWGARITGALDLHGVQVDRALSLFNCHFGQDLTLFDARLDVLNLTGSVLDAGLLGDGLETRGKVVLVGATAAGDVRLLGARVGGDLSCIGATFRGDVNCDGARIDGTLYWQNVITPDARMKTTLAGLLDLSSARIGDLHDDPACWPKPGNLALDRCQYGAFTGTGISAEARIRWLELQDPAQFDQDFWPQPWEHCAKVLREMGHRDDARKVSIRKEWHQKRDRRSRIKRDAVRWMGLPWWHINWGWTWIKAGVLRWSVGYGHAPFRALWWLFGLMVAGALLFDWAARDGQIKPNNAVVLRSPEWVLCGTPQGQSVFLPSQQRIVKGRQAPQDTRLACFHRQPEAQAFPAFNPVIYSIDTLIPLVDLELQGHWLPAEEAGWLGRGARVYLWLHIGLGWALSLLAVAGFTGLVRND